MIAATAWCAVGAASNIQSCSASGRDTGVIQNMCWSAPQTTRRWGIAGESNIRVLREIRIFAPCDKLSVFTFVPAFIFAKSAGTFINARSNPRDLSLFWYVDVIQNYRRPRLLQVLRDSAATRFKSHVVAPEICKARNYELWYIFFKPYLLAAGAGNFWIRRRCKFVIIGIHFSRSWPGSCLNGSF